LPFTTTAELPDPLLVFGQERAVAAIQFSIGMRRDGYNLFALGPAGAGKHAVVRKFLEEQPASEPPARDSCYVHNFEQPHRRRTASLRPFAASAVARVIEHSDRVVEEAAGCGASWTV
jgi:hypothetical protein